MLNLKETRQITLLMRLYQVLAVSFIALGSALAQAEPISYEATVVGISDGDTITVLDGNKTQHKIRLQGIDAPEKAQAFGKISKHYLSQLVFSKKVTIVYEKMDRYQRQVGKVLVDGTDANLAQITNGMAWHYKKYEGEQSQEDRRSYSNAEQKAQNSRAGLWGDDKPTPPWDYRKAKRNGVRQ